MAAKLMSQGNVELYKIVINDSLCIDLTMTDLMCHQMFG